jgi:hypothetical protein
VRCARCYWVSLGVILNADFCGVGVYSRVGFAWSTY